MLVHPSAALINLCEMSGEEEKQNITDESEEPQESKPPKARKSINISQRAVSGRKHPPNLYKLMGRLCYRASVLITCYELLKSTSRSVVSERGKRESAAGCMVGLREG